MILGSHSFVKRTCSLKQRKHQGCKLSHKLTKNTFTVHFLSNHFYRHKNDVFTCVVLPACFSFLNFMAMTWDMIKSTLCVSVTHFFSRGTSLDFSNSVVKSKYRGLLDWGCKVTPVFKNFGSKVHSIGSIAKLSLFVSFPLLWWVLSELIQSDYENQIWYRHTFSVWYMDAIIHKVRNYLSFSLS